MAGLGRLGPDGGRYFGRAADGSAGGEHGSLGNRRLARVDPDASASGRRAGRCRSSARRGLEIHPFRPGGHRAGWSISNLHAGRQKLWRLAPRVSRGGMGRGRLLRFCTADPQH